jgi:hypothetical protein
MPLPHILLALLVTLIWGVNFVVIKVGLQDFPPLLLGGKSKAMADVRAPKYNSRIAVPAQNRVVVER